MHGAFAGSEDGASSYARSVNHQTGQRTLVLKWGEGTFEVFCPATRYQEQHALTDPSRPAPAITAVFDGTYPEAWADEGPDDEYICQECGSKAEWVHPLSCSRRIAIDSRD